MLEQSICDYAPQHLCVANPVMIPHGATVYAQLVQSDTLRQHLSIAGTVFGDMGANKQASLRFLTPATDPTGACAGTPILHDMQIDQLQCDLVPLTDPAPVAHFDFRSVQSLVSPRLQSQPPTGRHGRRPARADTCGAEARSMLCLTTCRHACGMVAAMRL